MTGAQLRRTLKENNITQKDAAHAANIPQTTLSGWCNSQHVDDDKARQVLKAVGIQHAGSTRQDETTEKIATLTVEQVATMWGTSPATIRAGIQQGVFPWAYAVRTSDNRWTYLINAERFREIERISTHTSSENGAHF